MILLSKIGKPPNKHAQILTTIRLTTPPRTRDLKSVKKLAVQHHPDEGKGGTMFQ